MKKLKTTMLAMLILFLTPVISTAQETSLEFENVAVAVKLAKDYVAALQKGDVDQMRAQFSPNALIFGLSGGLDSLDVKQHYEYYTNSTNRFNYSVANPVYLPVKVRSGEIPKGEWILSWGTTTISDKESGTKISIPFQITSLVENGKITRMMYFFDRLNVMENLGYTLTPPKM